MKKLLLALVAAASLALGIAGSAAALPDNHACTAASGTPATAVFASLGGCEPHAP